MRLPRIRRTRAERLHRGVGRGARLLDRKMPGWHGPDRVDLDTLDSSRGTLCVAGQLAQNGWWVATVYDLGLGSWVVRDELWYGFNGSRLSDYPVLTRAWRFEVLRRRAGEAGDHR